MEFCNEPTALVETYVEYSPMVAQNSFKENKILMPQQQVI